MHQLPSTGYLRLPQIVGNSKIDPRITAWCVEDIIALIERIDQAVF